MGRYPQHIGLYLAMMDRLKHRANKCGSLAAVALAAAFFVGHLGNDGAGVTAPVVQQMRYIVGLVLLGGCGFSSGLWLWYYGRYVYFDQWPERFQEDDDL